MDSTIFFTAIVFALLGAVIAKWPMKRSHHQQDPPPLISPRDQIIRAYGKILEESSREGQFFVRESDLPFSKNVIRLALATALLDTTVNPKMRIHLELGFIELEKFLAPEEYEQASPFFDLIWREGQSVGLADMETKLNFLRKVAEGPNAAPIMDKVSGRTQRRSEQLRVLKEIAFPGTDKPQVDRQ